MLGTAPNPKPEAKGLGCREPELKETTGGEFRVYRASVRPSIRYIDLL